MALIYWMQTDFAAGSNPNRSNKGDKPSRVASMRTVANASPK